LASQEAKEFVCAAMIEISHSYMPNIFMASMEAGLTDFSNAKRALAISLKFKLLLFSSFAAVLTVPFRV
jgi:urea transporter